MSVASVGVVVVQYGPSDIASLVASLRRDERVGPIVVVRNPRDDESSESPSPSAPPPPPPRSPLHERAPAFVLLDRNAGYSAAVNRGRAELRTDALAYTLVVTHDVRLDEGCVGALVGALDADPAAAIAGPGLLDVGDGRVVLGATRHWSGHVRHATEAWSAATTEAPPRPVTWIDGAVMLLREPATPPFDERYFLYVEDVAVCLAVQPEHRVIVVPAAVARQESGMTARPGAHGYLITRNHLLLARDRRERRTVVVGVVRSVGSAAMQLLRALPRGRRRHHLRQAIGVAWGTLDGIRGVTGPPPARLRRWGDIRVDGPSAPG